MFTTSAVAEDENKIKVMKKIYKGRDSVLPVH
jgi:hypothetical protein